MKTVALLVSSLALCHLNVITIYCNLVDTQGLLLHVHVPRANLGHDSNEGMRPKVLPYTDSAY